MCSILFVHFVKVEDIRLILREWQQISPCSLCLLSGSTLDLKGGLKPKTPGHRGLESEMTFASESSVPYPSRADEYGVPLLDISSESDDVSSPDVKCCRLLCMFVLSMLLPTFFIVLFDGLDL